MEKRAEEQNKPEQVSDEDFMRYKNEIQIHLMLDAGIQPDDEINAIEWIEANSPRLDKIFDQKMAQDYEINPTEVTLKIKAMLYH
ncbi:MAG: hypothetical protein Q7S34_04685 [bacterium]|nr:hypothetical protein [bacterium]